MDNAVSPKKRPGYRIHWQTCLVTSAIAGYLLYLLLNPSHDGFYYSNMRSAYALSYGWPQMYHVTAFDIVDNHEITYLSKFHWNALAVDLSIMIAWTTALTGNCEFWLRRRATNKRWRVIHLSTALLLLICASVMLGLQLQATERSDLDTITLAYGWPFPAHYCSAQMLDEYHSSLQWISYWDSFEIFIDALTVFSILATVVSISEWLTARRGRKLTNLRTAPTN